MKPVIRIVATMLVALVCSVAVATAARAATISGFVTNEAGNPIPGVQVCVLSTSYVPVLPCTTTNSDGGYTLSGLSRGTYYVKLDPLATGYVGQTVVADVPDTGLCLDWKAWTTKPAVALASPGTGGTCKKAAALWPYVAFAGGALIVGGTLGGLCAAGVICGSSSEGPE